MGWLAWNGSGFGDYLAESALASVPTNERLSDGVGDGCAHCVFGSEPDFAFGRMDVHVHFGRIEFEEETADGVTPFHQSGVVTFRESEVEASVFDWAAVDK